MPTSLPSFGGQIERPDWSTADRNRNGRVAQLHSIIFMSWLEACAIPAYRHSDGHRAGSTEQESLAKGILQLGRTDLDLLLSRILE